jgi:carboxymethylenebutenolidase
MGHLGEPLAVAFPAGAAMIDLGDGCRGELYTPRAAPKGAVVILHERYGLVKHTLDLAQRLANDGYVALAPNLFSKFENQAALQRGEVRVILPDDEVARVIDRAIEFVKLRADRIALMGVCQSGRYPIVVGSRRSDLAACVVFYGASQQRDWDASDLQPRSMADMLPRLTAPALFVFAERDHTISLGNVRRVRDALESARRSYRMKVFPGMPHGFLNDTMPGRYRPKEAAQAWQLLLAFLTEVFAGEWQGRVRWEFEGASAMDYDFAKNVRLE